MKRLAFLVVTLGLFIPMARAQSELGVHGDYLHLSQTNTNLAGLGARVAFPVFPRITLEGEINYDFNQVFTETFSDPTSGTIVLARSNVRALHGLFGPKLDIGHGFLHPFLTLKAGFLNTQFDARPATLGTFVSSVENLRSQNISGTLYPGGGLEGRIGPVGLRLDVGDEMYFNGGTHHDFRVAFGPFFHF